MTSIKDLIERLKRSHIAECIYSADIIEGLSKENAELRAMLEECRASRWEAWNKVADVLGEDLDMSSGESIKGEHK